MKRLRMALWSLILLAVPAVAAAALPPAVADGAKKEGEIVLYGAIPAQASRPMRDLFERNYGVRVNNWRAGPNDIIHRLAESKTGGNLFDVVVGNEVVMAALEKKGLLDSFEPPTAQGFPRHLLHPERRMTPWRAIAFGINFNTQRLTPDQAPRKWEDLLDPKWKKNFLMPNPALHAPTLQFLLNLEKLLGPKWLNVVQGWARQKPRVTRDPGEEIPTLTSGEIPLGIGYIKDRFQYAGPIDYVRMDKYLASLSFVAVSRQAPHPNAARLFTDFFLGPEPQQMVANLGEYVLHPEIEDRFTSEVTDDQIVPMRAPSPAEREAWSKKFREMFK
jgi:iron(III) transport system substrate-binding protein